MIDEQLVAEARLAEEAWAHLKRTGQPATRRLLNGSVVCTYGDTGCAFMPAIKPEHLYEAIERNTSASNMLATASEWVHEWARPIRLRFATSVQAAHDDLRHVTPGDQFITKFAKELERVCGNSKVPFPADAAKWLEEHA